MANYCAKYSGFLIGENGSNAILVRTRCKQWDCEYCAKQNKRQWQARMLQSVNAHKCSTWGFYTLTAHKNAKTWETSLLNLQQGWTSLREKMRYEATKTGHDKLFYARVYEQHKDGRAHWHMIMDWIPTDYKTPTKRAPKGSRNLSGWAASAGMGWKTHVIEAQVKNAGYVVHYCTKYMTKLSETMPKGTRRVQTSHGWHGEKQYEASDYEWTPTATFTLRDAAHLWAQGKTVTDVALEHTISIDDFEDSEYYDIIPPMTTGIDISVIMPVIE